MLAKLSQLTEMRPQGCLKLGPTAAVWAENHGPWQRREQRCVFRSLPAGLIKPSPVDPNIDDMASLKEHVQAMVTPEVVPQPPRRLLRLPRFPRLTSLLLPDLCVRAAIIRLDELPSRSEERAALIQWRAAQEQLLPVGGTRVSYQVLGDAQADGPKSVLAVAIREPVLQQFETLCEEVGLLPLEVETVTFRLFNLWGQVTGWFGRQEAEDLLWVTVVDSGLTVMVVHEGTPVFFRTKLMPAACRLEADYQVLERRVVDEVLASMESCTAAYPQTAPVRLVLASDVQGLCLLETLTKELNMGGEELDWSLAQQVGWTTENGHPGLETLCAVAGLMRRG